MIDSKILFVCPKTGPWPPQSWGAVEIVVYELSKALQNLGVKVDVFPTNSLESLVSYIKNKNNYYSFLHLHYDDYHKWYFCLKILFPSLRIGATSHFAYLTQLEKQPFYSKTTFLQTLLAIENGLEYYPLTQEIQKRIPKSLSVIPNGASTDIRFSDNPTFKSKAICLAKVEPRKGQFRLQTFSTIDFIGPSQNHFQNYLGEWSRQKIQESLTEYNVLILMSEAEAAPLVILEGLMAGCGIVCTDVCRGNLPSLDWIRYLPLTASLQEIQSAIDSLSCSPEDRKIRRIWAEQNISWSVSAKLYLQNVFPIDAS